MVQGLGDKQELGLGDKQALGLGDKLGQVLGLGDILEQALGLGLDDKLVQALEQVRDGILGRVWGQELDGRLELVCVLVVVVDGMELVCVLVVVGGMGLVCELGLGELELACVREEGGMALVLVLDGMELALQHVLHTIHQRYNQHSDQLYI